MTEGADNEEYRVEAVNVIHDEVERLSTLINNLLEINQYELGGVTAQRKHVRMHEFLEDAFNNVTRVRADKNLEFDLDIPREMSMVFIDKDLFRIAVNNLLTNAIQAMPSGGPIEVAISSDPATVPVDVPPADDGFVCVSICDSGAGMTEDEAEHIFEPFFTTKETGKGTGLGLSIAYGIVREHHGWIYVDSKKGQGTQFRVYLPAAPQDQLPKQKPHSTSPKSQ